MSDRQAAERFWWLIRYDDADVSPEVFNNEKAARETFANRLLNWNCQLFVEARSTASIHEISEQLKDALRAYRRQHDDRYRIIKTDPMTPEDFDPTGEKCYCEICELAKGLLGER